MASVTIIALNEGKCQLFLLNRRFFAFQFGGFWQFFKPNSSKSGHGKSKLLLLSCREYLALGTFFVFSPNLKFFELLRKKSKNFDFCQEIHIFCTVLSKIRKILD